MTVRSLKWPSGAVNLTLLNISTPSAQALHNFYLYVRKNHHLLRAGKGKHGKRNKRLIGIVFPFEMNGYDAAILAACNACQPRHRLRIISQGYPIVSFGSGEMRRRVFLASCNFLITAASRNRSSSGIAALPCADKGR